ncbi:AraC-type DNA-binding protein [Zhouia amylolytica]|uniref:AraC-type DNA-binding protein n=1 Tax=Zhouia amylolytica TaxID=376730 RepID=A0A1I6QT01_9FLAO|nr:AraC family transcriptional regulator [Zhouia amylolytica]SFS55408.1 AraC-type DNA-binding protein [Zhouia amylolytica]
MDVDYNMRSIDRSEHIRLQTSNLYLIIIQYGILQVSGEYVKSNLHQKALFLIGTKLPVSLNIVGTDFRAWLIQINLTVLGKYNASGLAQLYFYSIEKEKSFNLRLSNRTYIILKILTSYIWYKSNSQTFNSLERNLKQLALVIFFMEVEKILPVSEHYILVDHQIFIDFLKLVNQHISSEHQVQFYADRLCVTPQTLSSKLKKISGKTAKYYLSEVLLQKAEIALSGSLSIIEISEKLGFRNPSCFNIFFKSKTNLTPTSYRKKLQKLTSKTKY